MERPSGTAPDLLGDLLNAGAAPAADAARLRAESERATLLAALEAEPWTFDFFQAVRRLEAVYREQPRTGESGTSEQDPVRFAQEPSLAFAPCTVASYVPSRAASPTRLFVNFLGMLGPQGPLPLHLTEFARDRERNHKDPTIARFLDVFNHRAISLFYRAWASAQMTVSFDRASFRTRGHGEAESATGADAELAAQTPNPSASGATEDRWSVYTGSLIGLGMPSLFDRDSMPDAFKLHFAGRLIPHVRNAEGLVRSVESYFRVTTGIREFVGQWLKLPERYYTRLGERRDSSVLGRAAILGQHVWDCQGKFTLVLGPMKLDDYERMLPNSDSEGRLIDWVRLYAGDEFSWEAQLILWEREVPKLTLGKKGRLGYTTWLLTTQPGDKRAPEHAAAKPLGRDPADLVLRPHPIKHEGPREKPTLWNSAASKFSTLLP